MNQNPILRSTGLENLAPTQFLNRLQDWKPRHLKIKGIQMSANCWMHIVLHPYTVTLASHSSHTCHMIPRTCEKIMPWVSQTEDSSICCSTMFLVPHVYKEHRYRKKTRLFSNGSHSSAHVHMRTIQLHPHLDIPFRFYRLCTSKRKIFKKSTIIKYARQEFRLLQKKRWNSVITRIHQKRCRAEGPWEEREVSLRSVRAYQQ